jgi:hypothetical protein
LGGKLVRKICIVGTGPSWNEAPFDDESWEIWTFNEAYKTIGDKRATRWFEIHDRYSPSKNTPEHAAFLQSCTIPLYMREHYDDIPASLAFPKDELMAHFTKKGCNGATYFTCTASWLIALAIFEDCDELMLCGIDAALHSEHGYQIPSCEYWIGLAEGMGKRVTIAGEGGLLKCHHLYGFEGSNKFSVFLKKNLKGLKEREKQYAAEEAKGRAMLQQIQVQQAEIRGALGAYHTVLRNWTH